MLVKDTFFVSPGRMTLRHPTGKRTGYISVCTAKIAVGRQVVVPPQMVDPPGRMTPRHPTGKRSGYIAVCAVKIAVGRRKAVRPQGKETPRHPTGKRSGYISVGWEKLSDRVLSVGRRVVVRPKGVIEKIHERFCKYSNTL